MYPTEAAAPARKYRCHVICSTHWDREWVNTELENRFFLIECFDELVELFEKDPEAKSYHLDAQAIPIEDYVEARPEMQGKLEQYVKEGRLLIGPWYTLPEMNVTDGECTIRNLLVGHQLSESFGKVLKSGYTPTGWGQMSQLPQIYQGFGIDHCLFYRGINQELTPAEYIWEAPDGTQVVGIRPSSVFSRANLWSWVYLPVVHDKIYWETDSRPYWPGNGQAYRWSKPGEHLYYELAPPDRYQPDRIPEMMEKLIDGYKDITTTNILPAFQGHDQSRPNPEVPRLIRDINERCNNVEMIYSNLADYATEVVAAVKGREDNVVVSGEMRHTNKSAPWNMCHLLPGITSCRAKLKIENRRNELALIRGAEPVAVMQHLMGRAYPAGMLTLAWKKLLTNHSHDSIGGCCLDRVISDVMFRGEESRFISEGIVRHGLPWVLKQVNTSGYAKDAVLLTAFNLLPTTRTQVARIEVDIPAEADKGGFKVVDCDGNELGVQIVNSIETGCGVAKWGFEYGFKARRYTAYVQFKDVPAMGYLTCEVQPVASESSGTSIAISERELENAHLKVTVETNGSLSVFDKATGETYVGLNSFEDDGEVGNAWIPVRPEFNRFIDTLGDSVTVRTLENGSLSATLEVCNTMQIPVSAADDFKRRSDETTTLIIRSEITLTKDGKRIDIRARINNKMKDHRLRVLFPAGVKTSDYKAAIPFDVVSRPVPKPDNADWVEKVQMTDSNSGFVTVSDGKRGLSILNQGIYEVEVKDDDARSIALTLLRCSWQHGLWDTNRWADEGFQNLGENEFTYAIYPHTGEWNEAQVHNQLFDLDSPFTAAQTGRNPGGNLPLKDSFLEVCNDQVFVSGIKKHERGDGVVVRLFNPSAENLETELKMKWPVKRAQLLTMNEEPLSDLEIANGLAQVPVAHHKILTVLLEK